MCLFLIKRRIIETELAWAAGFFDGEGCTSVKRSKDRKNIQLLVQVAQTDKRPLERFVKAVGFGNITGPYQQKNLKWTPHFKVAYNSDRGEKLLNLLWDFLSDPKKEQAIKVRTQIREENEK